MIGKMKSILGKSCSKIVPFYLAIVIPKEGPCIFAGFHNTIEEARSYVETNYPNRLRCIYEKIFLDEEPAIIDIKEMGDQ